MSYRLNAADIPAPKPIGRGLWSRTQLPSEAGDCVNDLCEIDEGLALAYACYQPQRELLETSHVERVGRSLTLTVCLEGASNTLGMDGQRFDFIAGHSTVAAFSSVRGERRFPAGGLIRQLRLITQEARLQQYGLAHLLDGVGSAPVARPVFFGRCGVGVQRLAQTLVSLHGRDAGRLDLQIAALSLLAEQARGLQPTARALPTRLRGQDQDRILRARELLMSQYEQPLTMAYLCASVGLNEFKLKQGFRELFGTSPFRMLTDIRMKKAWELLESGLYVSTVAYRLGYEHPSSFSTAFERYHRRTPKSVARSSPPSRADA